MPHKYAALLASKGIVDCPCATDEPAQGLAYRFVELPSWSLANYIPRGQMPGVPPRPPKPLNLPLSARAAAKQNTQQCSNWGGLSMFSTEEQARKFFLAQMSGKPYFLQTHIAELSFTDADGWKTSANTDGHFDLHESDTAVIFTAVLAQAII
jgi:hypothetical protein